MTQPFRLPSPLPVAAFKTYALSAPIQTHMRPATCAEVDCAHWLAGWRTTIDVSTSLGVRQAKYISERGGRTFTVVNTGLTLQFTFPPGQRCFREHHVPLEREPLYIVRGGDHRGNPTGELRKHANGTDWREDFAEHTDKLKQQMNRS